MVGKRRGRKKEKQKRIDEFELRRELRRQRRPTELSDKESMSKIELPEHPEEIRIGGIDGWVISFCLFPIFVLFSKFLLHTENTKKF